ncbi:MAG: PaaI family thioesterase [Alphaproteobacteria bacterium]|nr:PaaI family thioesterase [Alphaproteobacteria bacterium]
MAEGGKPDIAALLAALPYCAHLGIAGRIEGGEVLLEMPFGEQLIGNPVLPALHGGVIGSLLETAALVTVVWETRAAALPKPVDITVDYLRSGRALTSYARARIARQGRRVVNVHAEMWQDDPARPTAALRGHFLVAQP